MTRTIDGRPYFLSLTDTAGQEEYRGLWASSNLKSDAFLLVYDITNVSSLDTLDYFMQMIDIEAEQRIEENNHLLKGDNGAIDTSKLLPPPVKFVAGNKCDLKDARVVSSRQGLEWARRKGCGFMETSAREMVNIEETFARKFPLHIPIRTCITWLNLAVIVRRVVEARRLQAQQPGELNSVDRARAIARSSQMHTAGAHSVSRTPVLTPSENHLPLDEDEKSRNSKPRKRKRRGFWRTLRCWGH